MTQSWHDDFDVKVILSLLHGALTSTRAARAMLLPLVSPRAVVCRDALDHVITSFEQVIGSMKVGVLR